MDNSVTTDPGDDLAVGPDIRGSPVEGEGYLTDHSDLHHQRMPSDSPTTYSNPNHFVPTSSRHSSYEYPSSDISYRQLTSNEARLQYSTERLSPDAPSGAILRSPHATDGSTRSNQYQPYVHSQSQSHSSTVYPSDQNTAQGNWDDRDHPSRTAAPSWQGSHHNRPLSSAPSLKSYPPPSDWPAPASSSHSAGQSPNFPFPTLSAPFFPNQSHIQGNYPTSPSSPSVHSPSSAQYNAGQIPAASMEGRHGSGFDSRNYTTSPSISPSHSYPASSRESHLYQQHPSRSPGFSRGPPQAISTFLQPQSAQPSPPANVGGNPSAPPLGYWSREKTDEQ
jgi:hypothetical protein